MATKADDKPPPPGNPLDKAADRLRDSAKWLLASFGAVAVVIFAGLTVADLGKLNGDTPGWRFTIAIVGAAAAIIGIVAALARTMRLAGASTTGLHDLTSATTDPDLVAARTEAAFDPALRTWRGDFRAFVDDYELAYEDYVLRAEAYATSSAKHPDSSSVGKARVRLDLMGSIATRILRTVSFLRLQRAFTNARRKIACSIILTAVGAVAFAWATTGIPKEPERLRARPLAGILRPGEATVKELNRQLDGECKVAVGDEMSVVVLSSDDDADALDVVSVPVGACAPVRANVSAAEVTES